MLRITWCIAASGAFLCLATPPSTAQSIDSEYTSFDAKKCKHTRGRDPEDYGRWRCNGYAGVPILLAAGDQRMFVTYGSAKKDDLAKSQTFPAFNSAYSGKVEWRVEKQATGKPRPFATILRWNVKLPSDSEDAQKSEDGSGPVLVVTRLGPGGVCHVGYVDARANGNANELARKLADDHARTFSCGKDKRIVLGEVSRGLAMPKEEE